MGKLCRKGWAVEKWGWALEVAFIMMRPRAKRIGSSLPCGFDFLEQVWGKSSAERERMERDFR